MARIQFFCIFLLGQILFAQTYQLGAPSYAGSGCPQGSTSISATDDGQTISFLFDRFTSTSVGPRGSTQLTCVINVPVSITPGYSLDTTTIYYNGFASIPSAKHFVKLTTSGMSIQRMAPRFNTTTAISGPFQNNFSIEQKVLNGIPNVPKCPKNPNLNLIITAEIFGRGQPTSFTLDSADIGGAGLTVAVAIKPCKL